VVWPPPAPSVKEIELEFEVFTWTFTPVPGIVVEGCHPVGYGGCAFPEDGTSADGGVAHVSIPIVRTVTGTRDSSFYVQTHDPSGKNDDILTFAYPIPVHNPAGGGTTVYAMGFMGSVSPEFAKAHVAITMTSCGGMPGEGVVFSSPDAPTARALYSANAAGTPTDGATETGPTGLGYLVDVPIGLFTVEAHLKATGQLIASVPVHTREGIMTIVVLAPGPTSQP
jgi:hypothetical protein